MDRVDGKEEKKEASEESAEIQNALDILKMRKNQYKQSIRKEARKHTSN